jgi:hypothetical protein
MATDPIHQKANFIGLGTAEKAIIVSHLLRHIRTSLLSLKALQAVNLKRETRRNANLGLPTCTRLQEPYISQAKPNQAKPSTLCAAKDIFATVLAETNWHRLETT